MQSLPLQLKLTFVNGESNIAVIDLRNGKEGKIKVIDDAKNSQTLTKRRESVACMFSF